MLVDPSEQQRVRGRYLTASTKTNRKDALEWISLLKAMINQFHYWEQWSVPLFGAILQLWMITTSPTSVIIKEQMVVILTIPPGLQVDLLWYTRWWKGTATDIALIYTHQIMIWVLNHKSYQAHYYWTHTHTYLVTTILCVLHLRLAEVSITCEPNTMWRQNLHQLTYLTTSQIEAHSCKPWVTNLSIIPHTLGIITVNITHYIWYYII